MPATDTTSPAATADRVAIYARLSVSTEESVSVARQLEAARSYASARGWTVVAEGVDDGSSATKNRPEDRTGWRSLLDHPETFSAVIVWKVDRLARRVLDFLHADEMLRERGAALVAVEDPIDMTTATGRAFATMLAVFGEMEAEAMAARVKASRREIVKTGRRAGGRPPFGFVNVPNPEGPGMVLAQDPERIDVVRDLVAMALEGTSLYGLARHLEAQGIAPRARRLKGQGIDVEPSTAARWHEASVEAILLAPALAGMTPYRANVPTDPKTRRPTTKAGPWDVLRDAEGLPVVDESVAIITPTERRDLIATLEAAKRPGTRQYAGAEAALLYGLAVCAGCGAPMHRATSGTGETKARQYRCAAKGCQARSSISRDRLEAFVVDSFLTSVGRLQVVKVEPAEDTDTPDLADIEAAIRETAAEMTEDGADVPALAERLASLKSARTTARREAVAAPVPVITRTGETFAAAWERLEDTEDRRGLLLSALECVEVSRGGRGRAFDPARIRLVWRS